MNGDAGEPWRAPRVRALDQICGAFGAGIGVATSSPPSPFIPLIPFFTSEDARCDLARVDAQARLPDNRCQGR